MRRTMLRLSAPLISSIALALGLLGGAAEPLHAQGFNNFGGMGGGFGRRNNDRGDNDRGGGFNRRDNDRGGGGGNFGGPKGFKRDGAGPKESFGGPKGMSKDSGRGMSMGDGPGKGRGRKGMDERGGKSKASDGIGSRIGREDGGKRGGRWGKIERDGKLDKSGRVPKHETKTTDNPKSPGGKSPFPKRGDTATTDGKTKNPWPNRNPKDGSSGGKSDQASTGNPAGGPKFPWPNRNPKGGGKVTDGASTGGATDGGRNPRVPGKYPWPNRNPKGTDQATTNPTGGSDGTGKPPQSGGSGCFDHICPDSPTTPPAGGGGRPPQTGDDVATGGDGAPPCRGPRCPGGGGKPPQTGDDVATGGDGAPPCRGPRCPGGGGKPPQTGDDVATGGDNTPPCRGPRCPGGGGKPPQTGDDVATGDDTPPCRGPRCPGGEGRPPQTGEGPYDDGNCRGRNCGDGRPPRRPPVIVIGPIGPMVPPPDYPGEGEPVYDPPSYTPPNNATPVYEPAAPVRPSQPAREANRTPPPAPPSAALPPSPAPMPLRRDFVTADQPPYRPNELLVTVQGAQPDALAGQLAQSFNLVIEESQGFTLLENRRVYRFRIPDNRGVEDVVATISTAPGVTQSLPNFYHFLQGGAGELGGLQYALPKLRVPDTQDLVSGRGVTVAVIDSGVDTGHPALRKANIQFYDAVNGGVKDPDNHGTAITGIIAGKGEVSGIAPGVKVLAIRAFAPERLGAAPVTTSMALARATDVAVARGARVVNMSFAGPRDELLISLIDAAYAKGVVFIAAAGNQGPSAPPAYPAAYEKVIGITATDEADGLYAMANRGDYISVAAPGVDILVPVIGKGLDYMSGTSFAAAHISGIAALLIERNPKLEPDDVRGLLLEAAHDLGEVGRDDDFGAGLADAYGAVTMAVSDKVQSSSINQ